MSSRTAAVWNNDSDIDIVTDKGAVVVWDKDDLDASAVIYPMVPAHDNEGTLVVGSYAPIPVCDERIKITVTNGGNAGTGTFEFLIEGVALRVKMLTRAAGPDWKADAGVEIDLPLNVAAGLVSGGYAVALEKAKPAPPPGGSGGGNGCSGTSCGESRQSKSKAPEKSEVTTDGAKSSYTSGG